MLVPERALYAVFYFGLDFAEVELIGHHWHVSRLRLIFASMSSSRLLWACRLSRQRVLRSATAPNFGSRGLASKAPLKYNVPKIAVNRQSLNVLAVLLAATMCGAVGGYSIAHSTGVPSIQTLQTPKYGTAEDFKLAIKELKETFPRDGGVSTDEADLIIHGESPYHHHDGTYIYLLFLAIFSLTHG